MTVEPISINNNTAMQNLVNLIYRHIVFIIAACSIIGVVVVLFHFHGLQSKLVKSDSLERARDLSMTLVEFRTLYTSEVIKTAKESGLSVTHNYTEVDKAIPLPATLSMLLGNSLTSKLEGGYTKLYSAYPFPWREKEGGLQDSFARDAWEEFTKNSSTAFYLFEENDGREILRYAVADIMRPDCISCHNNHPDTPKNDWKVGDVRGILEVTTPINNAIAITEENFKETSALLFGMTAFGVLIIGLVVQALRRRERESRYMSSELQEKIKQKEYIEAQMQEYTDRLEIVRFEADAARDIAERSNQLKSEFLANMSHELRTPLNSLLILAEKFKDNKKGNLTDKQVAAATIMHASGEDLLTLINDLLDLAKVESGKLELYIEDISLSELVMELKEKFSPVADKKQLNLHINLSPDLPDIIRSDRLRVIQVLRNLLSNAFKFTHEGSVTVDIGLPDKNLAFRSDEPEYLNATNVIAFAVTDTGIGISEGKKEEIFKSFQQADGSTSREYGGTGLGLSISRELSRLLGGVVRVESVEGRGSTFTLYLPFEFMEKEIKSSNNISDNDGIEFFKRHIEDDRDIISDGDTVILIIEDDQNFINILQKEIADKGFKSIVAIRGREGINMAERYNPDAIILDMVLPDTSGIKIMDRLKSSAKTKNIPVYIMSIQEDNMSFTRRDAIGYLTKPVNSRQLRDAFDIIGSSMNERVKNILVVEDNDILRERLSEILEEGNRNINTVSTGEDALDVLKQQPIDCIILDIQLPGMSGFEVLESIAADHTLTQPPVIIYTESDLTAEDKERLCQYTHSFIQKSGATAEEILRSVLKSMGGKSDSAMEQSDSSGQFLSKLSPENKQPEKEDEAETTVNIAPTHSDDGIDEEVVDISGVKILVVDDDMRNTYALSEILEDEGVEVLLAGNGQIALDLLSRHNDVDLVLMDIMMPIMDGYEAIRKIRENTEWSDLPVIAVTAKALEEDKKKCLSIGATDYLPKPIERNILFPMIMRYLRRKPA